MNDYLSKWFDAIRGGPSILLAEAIEVEGVRDKHLGPKWQFAKVVFRIEPAATLEIEADNEGIPTSVRDRHYVDAAILGVLDVILTVADYPLKNVRLVLVGAEDHPADSSWMSFRHAGRDCGRKIMEAIASRPTKISRE